MAFAAGRRGVWMVVCTIIFLLPYVTGLGQSSTIGFYNTGNSYILADRRPTTPPELQSTVRILVDKLDWPGVIRAARDLAIDFGRVTGKNGTVELISNNSTIFRPNSTAGIILAGTIGKSALIDRVIQSKNISAAPISGKWETFVSQVVSNPLPGLPQALVIAGSDKRGTIYSLYDISEQIGVSPWYFWADVPPKHHREIYALKGTTPAVRGPPSVKYRGVFLNDEAPALTGWVNANFPRGKYGPGYNAEFYALIFELLLRLRANLLYPAMWDGMFAVDDARSQPLADEYGIVMGTSHTEPFARSTKEWKIFGKGAWNFRANENNVVSFLLEGAQRAKSYETLFTIGMRGTHDTPMSSNIETELLENIVKSQREILAQENMTDVPQSWCLYKEVQGYYDAGMTVPDDVTLLWADDNWGNIRRLPSEKEEVRKGGAGVYYHFDYVGDPRNYKWINTVIYQKTWHQMNLAYARHARDIWVVNVGDLKPLELPINHFMDMAYNITLWGPNPLEWLEAWAKRDFYETLAPEIARIAATYSNLVGERKYELVSTKTWSISRYQEAERVLYSWKILANEAYEIYNRLAAKHQPAFFEMVLHPIYAGENIHKLYISAAKNNLYAKQGRNTANFMAEETLRAFKRDHDITRNYHELLNGKWNHMMDQTHIGYTYWQQPMRQAAPPLQYVQALESSLSGDIRVVVEGQKQDNPGDDDSINLTSPSLPESSPNSPSRWFDISNTGLTNVTFQVTAEPFIKLSQDRGSLAIAGEGSDVRIFLALDWSNVPNGENSTSVSISCVSEGTGIKTSVRVLVPYAHVSTPAGFAGYVEADGYIAFDSWNMSKRLMSNKNQTKGPSLIDIWHYGVTLSPLSIRSLDVNEAPSIKIPVYTYATTQNSTISLTFAPSLNTDRDNPMRYALSLDNSDPQVVQVVHDRPGGELPTGWDTAVSEERWVSKTEWHISPGQHVLNIKLLDGGLVLKKVVVDLGGVRPSGLGPPESVWIDA